jgi:hypothetical protein
MAAVLGVALGLTVVVLGLTAAAPGVAAGVTRPPCGTSVVESPAHVDTGELALFFSLLELSADGISGGRGCADG